MISHQLRHGRQGNHAINHAWCAKVVFRTLHHPRGITFPKVFLLLARVVAAGRWRVVAAGLPSACRHTVRILDLMFANVLLMMMMMMRM
jgi:hypothetical protein